MGPAPAGAGVPAVIGMRDLVTLEAVRALLPALARELVSDGVIDRALAAARAEAPKGAGWSQAVLWLRLRDGRLWHGTPVAPPPPWRRPADRRSPHAWWEWLGFHRGRLLRGAARLLALYLALAALAALPPFQPRPGWRALGPRPPVKAIALGALDGTILLGSSTDATGCSPDTGIWRSVDGGAGWEAVSTPLALGDEPCATMAAVRGFASSPAAPGVLYAATGQAGLVRSDGAEGVGVGWAQVGPGALPASLRAVAVMPDDGERLFVAGDPGRIYRSTDGGAGWERLDGAPLCPAPEGRLPEQLDARALLAAPGAVFVATWGSATAPAEHAGIYASTDGGTCWSLLHDGARRYRYIALAAHGEGAILALTYDFRGDPGEEYQLWSIPRRGGRPALLWQDARRAQALYVDEATPRHWYVADSGAAVVRGSLAAGAGPPDEYPPQLRCLFACNIALAPDPAGGQMPLLLAEDQVYRFGLVSWYRALWP